MNGAASTTIYFGGLKALRFNGRYMRFADEDQAVLFNQAINTFKKEGMWPAVEIEIEDMANGETHTVSAQELAKINWKSYPKITFEIVFIALAVVALVVFAITYLPLVR